MTQYYIYEYLPSETQDMLNGARIVSLDIKGFELIHEKEIANGPYKSLKELKTNSDLYKHLISVDKKRAEKIILDEFIVKALPPIMFPQGLNKDYEKIIYRIMQHSKNGTIKGKDVKGIHLYNEKKVRILQITCPQNELGVFKAKIEALNERTQNWIQKESETTFFPLEWDTQRLINECYIAFLNRKLNSENETIGITHSGVKVLFQYSKAGDFKTVYPVYE